jgi:hypothetical protein
MARTKKTPERMAAIIESVRSGAFQATAAEAAGIDESTLTRWKQRDSAFALAIEKASADAEVESLSAIREAGRTSWQAHAWFLERTKRDKYALRTELAGAKDQPVTIVVESCFPGLRPGGLSVSHDGEG